MDSLRVEIFPADLDVTVDFYTRVLGFTLERDERDAGPDGYVALRRGAVRVGAAVRPPVEPVTRRPPAGVELVLEVADVVAERDRIAATGWSLDEDLVARPWGLTDIRLLDPDGHYWRLTTHE